MRDWPIAPAPQPLGRRRWRVPLGWAVRQPAVVTLVPAPCRGVVPTLYCSCIVVRLVVGRGFAWFDQDLKALVGRMILHAFDDDKLGLHKWYMGKVRFFGVSAADKREVPTANYKVYYDKKITSEAKLHGNVAHELSAQKYGPSQWWVLLKKA